MSAAELAGMARNVADTAHDVACNGPADGYPHALAQVAIAYAVLAVAEQLGETAEQLAAELESSRSVAEASQVALERIADCWTTELEGMAGR